MTVRKTIRLNDIIARMNLDRKDDHGGQTNIRVK